MGNYGIKISKAGKNITSTNPDDYIFNSLWGSVKIIQQGSGSLVVGASTTATATIAHGQSFAPMVMLFTELNPGSNRWYFGRADLPSGATDDITYISGSTYVSNTNFYLTIGNNTVSQKTIDYYYFMFGDTAEY